VSHSPYRILRGNVWHERVRPVRHAFQYPMAYLGLDLDAVAAGVTPCGVAIGRPSLLSFRSQDYLLGSAKPVREGIEDYLRQAEISTEGCSVELVTLPRFLGYVFNPVSFHLVREPGGLRGCVAEINNTFGERHLYAMGPQQLRAGTDGWLHCALPKVFHVSPFNPVDGEYRFALRVDDERVQVRIDLFREGAVTFRSGLELTHSAPLTRSNLAATIARMPLAWLGATTRILWHAAILRILKSLPAFDKPEPTSQWTIFRGPQILIQRIFFPRPAIHGQGDVP
jgi:DUF1365 family protein